jgi:asparagine synthase (glutamine-hydrolysing)
VTDEAGGAASSAGHRMTASAAWLVDVPRDEPGRARWTHDWGAAQGPIAVDLVGRLHDRVELARELGVDARATSDAALALGAYERWSAEALRKLRGAYALVVVDATAGRVIATRDLMGIAPLFYADTGSRVLLASLPQPLTSQPGVGPAINRVALADALCRRFPDPSETFFERVQRVPAGRCLVVESGRVRVEEYWAPATEADRHTDEAKAFAAFEAMQERAVRRCLDAAQPAIFLSGGLDSTSIAGVAASLAERGDAPRLVALALGFSDPTADERPLQRAVAEQLGLPFHLLEFDEVTARESLLVQCLALSRTLPFPLMNVFGPAYDALAGLSPATDVVLTGAGGDEWLATSPYFAADLFAHGNLVGLSRFARAWRAAYGASPTVPYGLRPLASAAIGRFVPRMWRRARGRRLAAGDPAWMSPDPRLRRAQEARASAALGLGAAGASFALADTRTTFDSSVTSMQMEEFFALGGRRGFMFLHPYFDADLVDFACRTPPDILNADGAIKGWLRRSVGRYLAGLGVEARSKVLANRVLHRSATQAARSVWQTLGGVQALEELGIVNGPSAAESLLTTAVSLKGTHRLWELLNTEAWLRTQLSSGSA